MTCYNCGKKDNYADNCPAEGQDQSNNEQQHVQFRDSIDNREIDFENSDEQMMQLEMVEDDIVHFSWTQVAQGNLNRYLDTDILVDGLDNFSVQNQDMLLNIRQSARTLNAYTMRETRLNSSSYLPGFFTVWYDPASMINILSLTDVSKKFRTMADTSLGIYITVHLSPSQRMTFEEVNLSLYLFRNPRMTSTENRITGFFYLMLATARLSDFTKLEIQ